MQTLWDTIIFYFSWRKIKILIGVSHLSAWAREEGFNADGSAWGWKLGLHDGSHERLHKSWRQSSAPFYLVQHLQHTHTHTLMLKRSNFCHTRNGLAWKHKKVRVYLGEKVKTAKVADNTVDFREAFAFSTRLKWENDSFNNVVIKKNNCT